MAESDKPGKDEQKRPLRNIDPAVEAKVDKMMTSDDKKRLANGRPGPLKDPDTAPLLPGEQLPDFDTKQAPANTNPAPAPEAKASSSGTSQLPPPAEKSGGRVVNNPATEKAVDEIVEEESDRMLAMEDAKAQLLAEGSAEIDRGFFNRIKSGLSAFWHNKWARNTTILLILAAIGAAGVYPTSRYYILNTFGVRASTSLRVIDEKTDQPLRDVQVSIDNSLATTDKNGNAKLYGIKLGEEKLLIKKPAFADFSENVTVGWGSNPLGDIALDPVGSRYKFEVVDYVSGKPIASAEASSGEASAQANKKGEIILVVADQNESKVGVKIKASGYRVVSSNLDVGDKDVHKISLVPSKKHAFVSKRSGTYDLYKIDIDGRNEKLILAGTGSESEDTTTILPNPDNNLIAYISDRGDHHGQDGSVLSDLMIVDLSDSRVDTIDYSESIQPLGFSGNKLVYIKIDDTEKDDSSQRQQLISYDTDTQQQKVLAKANYFNDALMVEGVVYYAPAQYGKKDKTGLYSIDPDGSSKRTVYGKEVWNLYRVAFDKLDIAVEQNWYEYNIADTSLNALNGAPPDQQSRIYTASPGGEKSAWVDKRDGKGVLLVYDTATGEDSSIHTQSGLVNPLSWLDADHLIYRVSNSSETADYVISLQGGGPKKIRDVTNTAGLDRLYYY